MCELDGWLAGWVGARVDGWPEKWVGGWVKVECLTGGTGKWLEGLPWCVARPPAFPGGPIQTLSRDGSATGGVFELVFLSIFYHGA